MDVLLGVMYLLKLCNGSCWSAVIGIGGAMADGKVVSLIISLHNKILGLGNTEYIELSFTVLFVFFTPLVVSLEVVLLALVASDMVLLANWLSLWSKVGRISVMRLLTAVAVVGFCASILSKMLHWKMLCLHPLPCT